MLKGRWSFLVNRPRKWFWSAGARVAVFILLGFALQLAPLQAANGDEPAERKAAKPAETESDHESIQQLLAEVQELRARVAELEGERVESSAAKTAAAAATGSAAPNSEPTSAARAPSPIEVAAMEPTAPVIAAAPIREPGAGAGPASPPQDGGGHNMDLPGGPKLNIRGFLDFNYGVGPAANALIYPLIVPQTTPPTPIHNTFQFGEFDLFMSSRLSSTINFLSEVVLGSDASNFWGLDVERAQITYKPSEYFQISGGRMHTAIGFYNTTYHHGTWFQTPTGRPFMYYFEDSGGILPVHIVGLEAAGLIPHTGRVNAHWIVEAGNGESSLFIGQPIVNQPVQNYLSDKDHLAFNIAGYIKPDWLNGVQIGANYYNDERVPTGIPHVNNAIFGAYFVFINRNWEFLNEFQVQRDHSIGSLITYHTPLGYTQVSRKFGKYRPYFRWQEVNVPAGDPLYGTVGRYEGPSVGLRMDFTGYAALKVQYNRIYTRDPQPLNGLDNQVSFTF